MTTLLPTAQTEVPTASGRWTRPLRLALLLGPLVLVVALLSGSIADVGRDRRLLVTMVGGPDLDTSADVLMPGAAVPLDLVVANPYTEAVRVIRLDVAVRGVVAPLAEPGRPCGVADFRASPGVFTALEIPARSKTSLSQAAVPPSQWPNVAMSNAGWNQDGCRQATVRLALEVWGRVG